MSRVADPIMASDAGRACYHILKYSVTAVRTNCMCRFVVRPRSHILVTVAS